MKDESAMARTSNTISVIICAYTEERWDDLIAAVDSVRQQTLPATEIIVVIDHNPRLLKRVQKWMPDVTVIENTEERGLRGARNCGVAGAKGKVIAFLDDDARAVPNWLRLLCEGYSNSCVLGTGGAVYPLWADKQPSWFPEEFFWVVGCSFRGMLRKDGGIRNPIGANMSMRREVFCTLGTFHSEIEQIGPLHAGGCEETELCIRVRQQWPESKFLYLPQASVFHHVSTSRASWRYYCSRCYSEGIAKSVMTRYVGQKDGLSSERSYVFHTLPKGIIDNLLAAFSQHDATKLVRAAAIITGLMITAMGYFIGSISLWIAQSRKSLSFGKLLHDGSAVPEYSRLHSEIER